MINITLPNGQILNAPEATCPFDLISHVAKDYTSPIVAAIVNNVETDLQIPLYEDCTVDFVPMESDQGMRIYSHTLLFMFLTLAKKRYPHVKFEVRNTLGTALYVKFKEGKLSSKDLEDMQQAMGNLAAKKIPIYLSMTTVGEFLKNSFDEQTEYDRKYLLENAPMFMPIYVYNLLDNSTFFFSKLCPNCGYINKFELIPFDEGVMLANPTPHMWNDLDNFEKNHALIHRVFQESNEWAHLIHCGTIAGFNKVNELGYSNKVILVSEALHEKKIIQMADAIAEKRDKIKMVLIAGPSSSGKTSTCQRLTVHLAVNRLHAIPISMDDYFVNREDTPKKPDGSYDFECVEAVDIPFFNKQMTQLLNGEKVRLPKFDFKSGTRKWQDKELQMMDQDILLIEGIHGLNEKLTADIPAENKIKIYVSALTPMSLNNYNRISTSDVRLMRRIVRDNQFRGHSALKTLNMWANVRAGEEKYIFPFQPSADVVFNTTLIYELAVLKKYAEPLLREVPQDAGAAYTVAQRLLLLLSFVNPIDDTDIPNNSILREFIGGSVFRDVL